MITLAPGLKEAALLAARNFDGKSGDHVPIAGYNATLVKVKISEKDETKAPDPYSVPIEVDGVLYRICF